jgi:NDP-sugar pyrophosphorylase family protein
MIREAVILAGGEGTRLRPVTYEIPKPLIPVQGMPILTWLTRWLRRHGVEHIIISVPAKWASVFEAWRSTLDPALAVELLVEPEPMGTLGGLVHHLSDRLGDGPIFVTNGDELKGLDLAALEAFHQTHKPAATVGLIRVPNPSDYGVAEMDGPRIARFHEKPAVPPSTLVSSGLYVVEPSAWSETDRSKTFLMFEKDLFPQLAAQGRLGGCALDGPWFDCGTFERWEKAIKEWPGE